MLVTQTVRNLFEELVWGTCDICKKVNWWASESLTSRWSLAIGHPLSFRPKARLHAKHALVGDEKKRSGVSFKWLLSVVLNMWLNWLNHSLFNVVIFLRLNCLFSFIIVFIWSQLERESWKKNNGKGSLQKLMMPKLNEWVETSLLNTNVIQI